MVKNSAGQEGYRSFRVVEVSKHGGCKTKFNSESVYRNKNPVQAAQKAFMEVCRRKRIKGQCSMVVTVVDTTRGASTKGKLYSYKIRRIKDPRIILEGTPNEYVAEYRSDAKSVNLPVSCKSEGQTRGRMKKKTLGKKRRMSVNNVRRSRKAKN